MKINSHSKRLAQKKKNFDGSVMKEHNETMNNNFDDTNNYKAFRLDFLLVYFCFGNVNFYYSIISRLVVITSSHVSPVNWFNDDRGGIGFYNQQMKKTTK